MKTPKLRSLTVNNFKNLFLRDGIGLKDLNILIGPNGSGKSNFISAFKFIKECIVASADDGRDISGFEEAVVELGGSRLLDGTITPPARIHFSYDFSDSDQFRVGKNFDLQLYVEARGSKVTVGKETLADLVEGRLEPFYFYKFHDREAGKGVVSVYDSSQTARYTHFEPLENVPTNALGLITIPGLLEDSPYSPEDTPIYKVRRELLETIIRWQFYNANDMNLKEIRTTEPKIGPSDVYLSSSGGNLALVLDNLIQKDIDFEEKLDEAMRSILPLTRRIRPVRSGRLALTLEWYFEGIGESFYLNEMSDGTVRMLCWATVLLSPLLPPLLVIDEPELGIHVSWMPVLAEWIKKASEKTQVFIITHSPDLLDHFTDSLENVFCFFSEDGHYFSVKTLSKDILNEKLNEGWELGDLYRIGDPNVGGWPW